MSFASSVFVPFLAIYLIGSAVVSRRQWIWWAMAASCVFYGYWDWRFLFLIYGLATVSWYCGLRIAATDQYSEKKPWVVLSVASGLIVLGTFKYFNFFAETFVEITTAFGIPLQMQAAEIILPVGISFYTFQALSYTVDLYRGKLRDAASLVEVTVYLSFFPQLVAGPIVRAATFLPQIRRGPCYRFRNFKIGLLLIAWGYFLKLCLADFIGLTVDQFFLNPGSYNSPDLIVGIIGYSFQIYGDFAGYSLVAIGIAKLQGFHFPTNFAAPYFSRSFSEFWSRWHISLSSWLRDYLYIPLGGNRQGRVKEYRNLMVTMLLGGLWHGASWNFVFWGFLHGCYLVGQRALRSISGTRSRAIPRSRSFISSGLRMAGVYVLVLVTWIFFRIRDFDDALVYLNGILAFDDMRLGSIGRKFEIAQVAALITATVIVDTVFFNRRRMVRFVSHDGLVIVALAVLVCTIQLVGSFGGGAFIYFQF